MINGLVLLLAIFPVCHAATIVGFGPVTGSGTGALVSISTPSINNDNAIGPTLNEFEFSLVLNGFGAIDHPIIVVDTGAVTEYLVRGSIRNATSLPIIGWTFGLPGSPYDFDFPDFDSPVLSTLGWANVTRTDKTLEFTGGPPLLPGNSMGFIFNIDVPICSVTASDCSFTSIPVFGRDSNQVPEPASYALILLPLLAIISSRRRR